MLINIFIEKTWTHLIKLTWKIVATQKDISNLFKLECHFQDLFQSLLNKYTIIQNIIDVQNKLNIKKKLQKLQEKKAQLKIIKIML